MNVHTHNRSKKVTYGLIKHFMSSICVFLFLRVSFFGCGGSELLVDNNDQFFELLLLLVRNNLIASSHFNRRNNNFLKKLVA